MSSSNRESIVILPITADFVLAPDVYRHGKNTDIGSLAEGLALYDKVIVIVESSSEMSQILTWFRLSDRIDNLLDLLESGQLVLHHYDFSVDPHIVVKTGHYAFANVVYENEEGYDSFAKKVLKFDVKSHLGTKRRYARFQELIRSSVIISRAEDFGKNVEIGKELLTDSLNYENIIRYWLLALQEAGYDVPMKDIKVKIVSHESGSFNITLSQSLDDISAYLGRKAAYARALPMIVATTTNRLLWTAARLGADVYVSNPSFAFMKDRFGELAHHATALRTGVRQLNTEVEFPNIRLEANRGGISSSEAIVVRERMREFRTWLHSVVELDRNLVQAYLNDSIVKSPVACIVKKYLKIMSHFGAAASSLGVSQSEIAPAYKYGGVMVSESAPFLLNYMLDKFIQESWQPKAVGSEIKNIVDKAC